MPPALSDQSIASPFHEGEKTLQRKNGSRKMMEEFGSRVIRPYMPDQHRIFFAQLPFVVLGTVDAEGWPWASILPGKPGFVQSPDNQHLDISLQAAPSDPLRRALRPGAPVGLLGIDPHSRRRNRMNGRISQLTTGQMQIRVDQSFGNCPQYIQNRELTFLRAPADHSPAKASDRFLSFDNQARHLIEKTDVFFVASAAPMRDDPVSEGVDVSHRGGRPGFIKIEGNSLIIPDFPGNKHFNTLGNFLLNPRAGLLFPDFETGDLLLLTGETELLSGEAPEIRDFRGAERGWRFTLRHGLWLQDALPFRASLGAFSPNSLLADTWSEVKARQQLQQVRETWRSFRVAHVQQESSVIRSFNLEPEDGGPLLPFEAGQHLLLRARSGNRWLNRSYTVSSAPGEAHYRISVKREAEGEMSRLLHDTISSGDVLDVKPPRGDFFIDPAETRPAVLLAGGVGITPMIAMAKHLLREGQRTRHLRPVTVLHASKDSKQRAFAEEFRQLQQASEGQIRYLSFVSTPAESERPGIDYNGTGHINPEVLRQVLPLDDYDFYLCGPKDFMQALYDDLRALGVADTRIHAESFGPSALRRALGPESDNVNRHSPAVDEAEQALVSFDRTGTEHSWTPKDGTLLELAETHGMTPAFSCRSGSCGSCATRVLSGGVSYRHPPSAGIEPGMALLCCARPAAGTAPLKLDL